ncbi:AbrB/MazE/SpoVT family DNA-binding domain-containing protein [Patescibacteria group bacterium]|nr:AbrB/MazE/SpoVT family DNA-binding domain-containing protein [Actinomycetota bacterium]MBU4480549.1 AbrB/MazE/SpoVT family DNA-binding domain-containing protein [Patescibacteria group bacterium]MCG2791405.1 AbrB/MazE/SpoVT family DNA-binding domain-containing protein [Actinomycetes bacterium]
MSEEEILDVQLRPKRQITLPSKVCEKLGIEYGDRLELRIKDDSIIVKPKKTIALNALNEIRKAFKKSGVTEEELIKSVGEKRHGKA